MDVNFESFFDELGLMQKEAGIAGAVTPFLAGVGRATQTGLGALRASGGKLLSGNLKGGVGQAAKNVGGALKGGFAQGSKTMIGPMTQAAQAAQKSRAMLGAGVLGAGTLGAGMAGKAVFGGGQQ